MLKHVLFVLLLFSGTYYYWITKPVVHGPGVVAPESPKQSELYRSESFNHNSFKIIPKAKINLEARVLSIKNYYFDQYADLSTKDVVFGWGPMSDEDNLDNLLVRQSDRSFYWEMTKPPIEQSKMWQNASNMHLIPSNNTIKENLEQLRKGHVVRIEGYLVDVESNKGWQWKTSLSRDDIGNGSSELVWINNLTIL